MLQNNGRSPFFMAPASAFALLVLLTFLGFFVGAGTGALLRAGVFIFLAFGAIFLLFGRDLRRIFRGNGRAFSKSEGLLSLSALFFLIFLSGALEFGLLRGAFALEKLYLYGFSLPRGESFGDALLLLLSGAILPVFGEEALLRGMLFRAYGKAGAFWQIAMPALLGAMLTGRFSLFPMGLFLGLLLGLLRFVTGSLWAGMLTHLGYRLYALFGTEVMWRLSFSSEARVLFTCLMAFFAGLALAFFLHTASGVLASREDEDLPAVIPKARRADVLWDVLFSPPLWLAVLLFLAAAVLRAVN